MSTVDYINEFVKYLLMFIEEITKFFNKLTGKGEEAPTDAPEAEG